MIPMNHPLPPAPRAPGSVVIDPSAVVQLEFVNDSSSTEVLPAGRLVFHETGVRFKIEEGGKILKIFLRDVVQ